MYYTQHCHYYPTSVKRVHINVFLIKKIHFSYIKKNTLTNSSETVEGKPKSHTII